MTAFLQRSVGTLVANVDYMPATWASQRLPSILALAPTAVHVTVLSTANVSTDLDTGAATSTGLFAPLVTENGGVIQVKSGTTPGGVQIGRQRDFAAASPTRIIANVKTQQWAIAGKVKIVTAADAQARLNCLMMTTTGIDIDLGVVGSVSTTNFAMQILGGGTTSRDTGQAVDLGIEHNIALVYDLSKLWFVYDDVANANPITDLSNMDTTAGGFRSYATNGSTAANREFHLAELALYTPQAI